MTGAVLEQSRRPGRREYQQLVLPVLLLLFFAFLVGGGALGLLTQETGPRDVAAGVTLVGVGAYGIGVNVRDLLRRRDRFRTFPRLRLDDDGAHVWQRSDDDRAADGWLSLPWDDLARVDHVVLDDETSRAMAYPHRVSLLRLVLRDDSTARVPDGPPPPSVLGKAMQLGLTPTQARCTLVVADDADLARVTAWLRVHRPGLASTHGGVTPWVHQATPDPWPGRPRVAVTGSIEHLRRVLPHLLDPTAASPVALVRNERHRAELERLGAEVRMIDPAVQGPRGCALALLHCTALVVHVEPLAAPADPDRARGLPHLLAGFHHSLPKRVVIALDVDAYGVRDGAAAPPDVETLVERLVAVVPDAFDLTLVAPGAATHDETAAAVATVLADETTAGRTVTVR